VESVPILFWILVKCYWLTSLTLDFTLKETVAAHKEQIENLNIKLKVSFCTAFYTLVLSNTQYATSISDELLNKICILMFFTVFNGKGG
jgi:hypothetical protein